MPNRDMERAAVYWGLAVDPWAQAETRSAGSLVSFPSRTWFVRRSDGRSWQISGAMLVRGGSVGGGESCGFLERDPRVVGGGW